MARPCACSVCTGGLYGAYTILLHQAQADTDPGHRQQAMTCLAAIAPFCGGDNATADAMAVPVLAQLYPPAPDADTDPVITGESIEAAAAAGQPAGAAAPTASPPGVFPQISGPA